MNASRPSEHPPVREKNVKTLLFLTFSVLVANPRQPLYMVANPARGLLNREKRTQRESLAAPPPRFFFFFFSFNLTYSRWTSSLPSCLWSQRIFPSLPGLRLTTSHRDASSALLQLVNQWLNFTYSRSHAFRCERKNTNPTLVRIELTTSALAGVQVTYSPLGRRAPRYY